MSSIPFLSRDKGRRRSSRGKGRGRDCVGGRGFGRRGCFDMIGREGILAVGLVFGRYGGEFGRG